jgi:hypothetical protein
MSGATVGCDETSRIVQLYQINTAANERVICSAVRGARLFDLLVKSQTDIE